MRKAWGVRRGQAAWTSGRLRENGTWVGAGRCTSAFFLQEEEIQAVRMVTKRGKMDTNIVPLHSDYRFMRKMLMHLLLISSSSALKTLNFCSAET